MTARRRDPPSPCCRATGSHRARERRGAVLPGVLVVLALLGLTTIALSAGTRAGQWRARRSVAIERARRAADGAPVALLAGWADAGYARMAVGAARDTELHLAPDVGATVRVRRLSAWLYAASAEARVPGGEAGRPLARRTTHLLVVLAPARLPLRAALTGGDTLVGDGGTVIDGRDTLPAGWGCGTADSASVPAIALPPGVPPPAAALAGSVPSVLADSDAASAARYRLEPPPGTAPAQRALELSSLVRPDVRPRLAADGGCDLARDDVWGDPARASPCGAYLPVVHVRGDLVEPRGEGQGVLVVDGDLLLDDGFAFAGVVLVGGRVVARGGRLLGALLVRGRAGPSGPPGDITGLRLRWSSCVAAAALRAAGGVRPASRHGWQGGGGAGAM